MLLQLLKGRKIKSKFFLFGEGYYIPLDDFSVEIKRDINNNSMIYYISMDDITINIVLSKPSLCITDFNKFDIKTDRGTFLGCYIQSIHNDNKTITLKPDYYLC